MVKLETGFSFACVPMGENAVVAVVDERLRGNTCCTGCKRTFRQCSRDCK